MKNTCKDCRFYLRVNDYLGYCHRYAPRPNDVEQSKFDTHWPATKSTDWCGEWKPIGDPLGVFEALDYLIQKGAPTDAQPDQTPPATAPAGS